MTTSTEGTPSSPIPDLLSDSLLREFPEGARLVGSVCRDCGTTMIGSRVVCSTCISREVTRVALSDTGELYSFTRIHGKGDEVRVMGYVDLDGGVRTLTTLRETGGALRPGVRVELRTDGDDWYFVSVAGQ